MITRPAGTPRFIVKRWHAPRVCETSVPALVVRHRPRSFLPASMVNTGSLAGRWSRGFGQVWGHGGRRVEIARGYGSRPDAISPRRSARPSARTVAGSPASGHPRPTGTPRKVAASSPRPKSTAWDGGLDGPNPTLRKWSVRSPVAGYDQFGVVDDSVYVPLPQLSTVPQLNTVLRFFLATPFRARLKRKSLHSLHLRGGRASYAGGFERWG